MRAPHATCGLVRGKDVGGVWVIVGIMLAVVGFAAALGAAPAR